MNTTPKTPQQLSDKFGSALAYTHKLHASQVRKGSGVPYISHLLSVAALVLEDGGSETEAIAALLHDAVEDQGGAATRQAIADRFGPEVVAIVDGCTESTVQPKPDWQTRKQKYLVQISQSPKAVQRVALADKLHNARSILADLQRDGHAVWERFKAGRQGTLWFYTEFTQRVAYSSPMMQELKSIIQTLEAAQDMT